MIWCLLRIQQERCGCQLNHQFDRDLLKPINLSLEPNVGMLRNIGIRLLGTKLVYVVPKWPDVEPYMGPYMLYSQPAAVSPAKKVLLVAAIFLNIFMASFVTFLLIHDIPLVCRHRFLTLNPIRQRGRGEGYILAQDLEVQLPSVGSRRKCCTMVADG